MEVSMTPQAMALTVILLGASSLARAFVKEFRAPFDAEYATSMEMMGASISLCKLTGDEMKAQLDYPVNTPFYCQK